MPAVSEKEETAIGTADAATGEGKRSAGKRKNGRKRGRRSTQSDYSDVRSNQGFEDYYRKQQICDESEFGRFMEELLVPLGTAFRIVERSGMNEIVSAKIEGEFGPEFAHVQIGPELDLRPPKRLHWYPKGLGWSFSVPRPVLRKHEKLKDFFNFLKAQNFAGNINRQEAVSMLPPLLLDLHPGQRIIDLCAAPGSKTAQILDAVAMGGDPKVSSLVVANDSDTKRCNTLCHQLKRFGCQDLVVTNHQAQQFPSVIKFDRVLCDVPCSGDGTLRKAPDLWAKWTPGQGNGLHRLQVAIGTRAIELLESGGRMVYSTCSFNPVENEAVVAKLLAEFGDSVTLEDVSTELPGLKRRKGLNTWWVRDAGKEATWYKSYAEVPQHRRGSIIPSMFPPEAGAIPEHLLERCVRLLPHDQDTGGFFIAVFGKKKDDGVVRSKGTDGVYGGPQGGRRIGYSNLLSNEPMLPLREVDPSTAQQIQSFYGITEDWVMDGIHARGNDTFSKRLYLMSERVRQFLGEGILKTTRKYKLRALSAGIRAFERCPREGASCSYRIVLEAVALLLPYIQKRTVEIDRNTFLLLLSTNDAVRMQDLCTEGTRQQLLTMEVGTTILRLQPSADILVVWRGGSKISMLMPKEDLQALRQKYDVTVPEAEKQPAPEKGEPPKSEDEDRLQRGEHETGSRGDEQPTSEGRDPQVPDDKELPTSEGRDPHIPDDKEQPTSENRDPHVPDENEQPTSEGRDPPVQDDKEQPAASGKNQAALEGDEEPASEG